MIAWSVPTTTHPDDRWPVAESGRLLVCETPVWPVIGQEETSPVD